MKRAIPQDTRRSVAARHGALPFTTADAECEYCGALGRILWVTRSWVYFEGLELDHIVPEFLGGTGEPANVALACRSCNRRKGHRRTAADTLRVKT